MILGKALRKYAPFYLFLLPALIWYAVFAYYPMTGVIIAFKKFQYSLGIYRSHWVGFRYFIDFLSDPHFYDIIRNTVVISLAKLAVNFPAPIILALMFNAVTKQYFKRAVQTVSYLPYFISWVVVAALIHKFFSPTTGMINDIRLSMGLQPIYYLGEKNLFLPFIVLSDMWKRIGYGSIIYLAALSGIDPTLYEAADIDGANGMQKLWHITLTGIKNTVGIMFLLSVDGYGTENTGCKLQRFDRNKEIVRLSNQAKHQLYFAGPVGNHYAVSLLVLSDIVIQLGP